MDDKPSILVIEDDEDYRTLLLGRLTDAGYPALGVADSAAALSAMGAVSYDILLCDLMMPGQSGLDLLRHLRRKGSEVAFVFITAFASPKLAVEAMRLGASDLLEKPVKFEEVEAALRRIATATTRRQRGRAEEERRAGPSREWIRALSMAIESIHPSEEESAAFGEAVEALRIEGDARSSAPAALTPRKLLELCESEAARLSAGEPGEVRCEIYDGVPEAIEVDSRIPALVGRVLVEAWGRDPEPRQLVLRADDGRLIIELDDPGAPPPERLGRRPFRDPSRLASWARTAGSRLCRYLAIDALARATGSQIEVRPEGAGTRWQIRMAAR